MYKESRVQASTPDYWSKSFLREKSFYFGRFARLVFGWNRKVFDRRWREISRRVAPGSRMLDAGCGLGKWVRFCRANQIQAIGLDYSEDMVRSLKENYPDVEWIVGSIQDIPLPDCSLDAIISWGVIEHDEAGPQRALRDFHRVLKPGGKLFVTVPYDSPNTRRASEIHRGDNREGETFYQYFFTEQELSGVLEECGFHVETVFPDAKHYAIVFPRAFLHFKRYGHMGDALAALLLRPYLAFRPDGHSMVFAAATK